MVGPAIAAVLTLLFMFVLLLVFFVGYEAGKEAQERRHRKNSY